MLHSIVGRGLAGAGVLLLLGLIAIPVPAAAQVGTTGTLNGQVMDASRAALPGVTVTATHEATGDVRVALANQDGYYTLASFAVGRYSLTFQLEGFKTLSRPNVLVEAAVP